MKFDSRVSLILSGTLVGTLAYSVTSMIKYIADTSSQLPEMTHWLMGSLSKVDMKAVLFALPFMIIGLVIIYLMRFRINVLSLSDVEASSMGLDTKKDMVGVIAGSTLLLFSGCVSGGTNRMDRTDDTAYYQSISWTAV